MKSQIFDINGVKQLSDEIKSQTLACKLTLEDKGRKPSVIAQDVYPTSQSYRDAVSPPPGRKAPPGNAAAPQGGSAGKSQFSGSGTARGDRPAGCAPMAAPSPIGEKIEK